MGDGQIAQGLIVQIGNRRALIADLENPSALLALLDPTVFVDLSSTANGE